MGLGFFTLTRLTLLLISWPDVQASAADLLKIFSTGLLFDSGFFSYALIVPTLYLWLFPQKFWGKKLHGWWLKLVFFAALYAGCFVAVAEYLFWDEFSVRFNFISIDYLIYRREVTDNILESYPVGLLFAGMFVVALLLFYLLRGMIDQALLTRESLARRLIALLLLGLPVVSYFGLNQPLRQVSGNVYQNELASNGPYQFVAAFRNNQIDYRQFYASLPKQLASDELRRAVSQPNATYESNRLFDIKRTINNPGPEKRLNIIMIMVESLSSDYIGYFGNRQNLTPNLDALIDKSLFFTNFYATGTRTTRGLEAVTLSIPPTPGRSIVKRIGRETDQWSLGNVLDQKGYQSYFIYGGRSYFENMNAFFGGNGYRIIDQSSVPDEEMEFTNAWGMSDGDIYRQTLKAADRSAAQQKPFFMHLMTTSNHRPYTYPEGKIDIPSGSGRPGAIKYTDYAIGEFLRQARSKPWFKDTLFVILADHQAGSAGKRALPVERYHIPLWIYSPGHVAPGKVSTLASQIDLPPTLLGLLNMSYESFFFGKDILRMQPDEERAFIANYQNLGLFDGRQMAILEPRKVIRMQRGLASGDIEETAATADDPLVRRTISYYQGAAYIFGHRLNAWNAEK
ncbi:MAG: LTA synthase family protein [Deltaproteobacteria bacterium]|nr:LTA synthase family protein [Deltaproteobacteria bacterium]